MSPFPAPVVQRSAIRGQSNPPPDGPAGEAFVANEYEGIFWRSTLAYTQWTRFILVDDVSFWAYFKDN